MQRNALAIDQRHGRDGIASSTNVRHGLTDNWNKVLSGRSSSAATSFAIVRKLDHERVQPEHAEASSDAASTAIPDPGGVAEKVWIDPSIAAWRSTPWRKVHIEYHTSRHVPQLAKRFDADEFGDRLLEAHVNGATVFAKDMYGYTYFPDSQGRTHPNLGFDLLGAQVAALRKRKIWYTLVAAGHSASVLDAWTTRRAISGGYGVEGDPIQRPFANSGAVYASTQICPLLMDFIG